MTFLHTLLENWRHQRHIARKMAAGMSWSDILIEGLDEHRRRFPKDPVNLAADAKAEMLLRAVLGRRIHDA